MAAPEEFLALQGMAVGQKTVARVGMAGSSSPIGAYDYDSGVHFPGT
jgi:hypothetical protein